MWQTAVSVLGRCVGAGREDKGEKRDRDAGEGTGRTCREREEARLLEVALPNRGRANLNRNDVI